MYLDSTRAIMPPLSGTNVPGQRSAIRLVDNGGAAVISPKLTKDRAYHLITGVAAVRVTWRGDRTLAAASGVSTTTDFRIPPNTIFTFQAFEGQKSEDTGLPQYGSCFVYVVGDGGGAFEVFIHEAGR